MDLADDCLAQLDVVVASVHSAFNQDEAQMTDRVLRAVAMPVRRHHRPPDRPAALKREPYKVNVPALIDAAAAAGVALEINCQVDRLDLCDTHAKLARDRGVKIVISTDSHSRGGFRAEVGGDGGAARVADAEDVLNTQTGGGVPGRACEET